MTDIYLCVTVPDRQPILKAVYDSGGAAKAWRDGVEAGYTRGYTFLVDSNEGAVDLPQLVHDWDNPEGSDHE